MTTAAAMAWLIAVGMGDPVPATPPASAFAALGDDAVQDVVILGETRPIFLRLRVLIGDRSFRTAWTEATRTLHTGLDRNGDGRLTVEEAEAGGLARLVVTAGATPSARPAAELDVNPKDGTISVEELTEACRTSAGPFRLQVDGVGSKRTDALFDHLDRDKDGLLTRPELAAIVGMLRRLDRDDNELISAEEVAVVGLPTTAASTTGRSVRDSAVPPAVELDAAESPARLVRLLIKKYDAGSARGPGKLDSRLSPEEFAIPARAFASADANGDGTLNAEELRAYVVRAPRDAIVDVALAAKPDGRARAWVRGVDGGLPEGLAVRQLVEGVVEIDVGPIRLDVHIDDGVSAADATRRLLRARFEAEDANADGYLEESELTQDNGQPSALAGIFRAVDRDGDGKLYPRELDEYVARQATAARARLTLTASDEGRALFGMLDLDRDRQLGAREVLDTYARVTACDRDGDGRISPDEIPHHIQLTLSRGDLSALLAPMAGTPSVAGSRVIVAAPMTRPAAGPPWFRRMDRNRDGDVSRREFLGTRSQFDRLDRDGDGLLGPDEAEAATRAVKAPGG
jgi:Ca2+-binding EF-hand superfamily protein